ncbi:MAG: sugar transferase [Candidatus Marinimicrobia bacterium]|nr:sugar transferase [Candidatus Neomarinimicrobiota bacterium]
MPSIFQKLIALLIVIGLSPIIFIAAIAIFLDDGFPILFIQKRTSQGKKMFNMYKFRTMVNNSEEILKNDKELYKIFIENDHKIPEELETRLLKTASFIRKTSIDEIPQLFNVLLGHINLVGNRPVQIEELKLYPKDQQLILSKAKCGVTGLWQVSGRSNIKAKDRHDIEVNYVKNRSSLLDIKIIIKTCYVVLRRFGSH